LTTYTFGGLRWTEGGSGIGSVAAATFRLVVSDGFRFEFAALEPTDSSLTQIAISAAAGQMFSATLDGFEVTADWRLRMMRVDLPGGDGRETNLIDIVDESSNPVTFRNYLFELGGPRIGSISSPGELEEILFESPQTGLWTSAFLEGAAINPGRLSSLTAVTENDVIDLSGQTWTGGTIRSGLGADAVTGTALGDVIELGAGRDVGRGGGGADRIFGQAGNDRLLGGLGSDTLVGGAGNDVLEGGTGNDRLVGEEGVDVFVLKTGFGRDTIVGFEDGVDKIDLSSLGLVEVVLLDLATQVGSNVVFAISGDTERLVVLNTTITALQGDFIL
jgi:RTX calcium-binding nonapeptide repeat (4 copies)